MKDQKNATGGGRKQVSPEARFYPQSPQSDPVDGSAGEDEAGLHPALSPETDSVRASHDHAATAPDLVGLAVLPKQGDTIIEELAAGNIVVARSDGHFLYVMTLNDTFQVFSHSPGSPGGGRNCFPKDEKHIAAIRNLATLADSLFAVSFDRTLDVYGVMSSAEEGILTMFPGDDRDADGDIEFLIPDTSTTA